MGKFLVVPVRLVLDRDLVHAAVRLWADLAATAAHKDAEGNLVNVRDRRDLAADIGLSYVRTTDLLNRLQEKGWLKVDRIPDQMGRAITIYEVPRAQ